MVRISSATALVGAVEQLFGVWPLEVYLSRKRCVFRDEISTLSSTGATKAATGARASAKLSFISFYPFLMLSPQNPEGGSGLRFLDASGACDFCRET